MINTIIQKIQNNKEYMVVLTYLGQKDNRDLYRKKMKQTTVPRLSSWESKTPKSKLPGPGHHARNTYLGGEQKGIQNKHKIEFILIRLTARIRATNRT
jgi:hypothetical protein